MGTGTRLPERYQLCGGAPGNRRAAHRDLGHELQRWTCLGRRRDLATSETGHDRQRVAHSANLCYASLAMPRHSRALVTRSFRIDPELIIAARLATGAKDDTEAVRIALAELVERARFQRWVRKVAGKGRLRGADA